MATVVVMVMSIVVSTTDNNIDFWPSSVSATIIIISSEPSMSWLRDNHVRLLLDHGSLLNLLSLLLVAVYWLLVISSCDSLWLVVSSRDSLLLNYWPHRWVHLWLRMGCDSLNWLLRYMCWWGHHNILGFWSISLRVRDQSIELGNLIFRLLVDSFRLEVNHHQRVPGELVLT